MEDTMTRRFPRLRDMQAILKYLARHLEDMADMNGIFPRLRDMQAIIKYLVRRLEDMADMNEIE